MHANRSHMERCHNELDDDCRLFCLELAGDRRPRDPRAGYLAHDPPYIALLARGACRGLDLSDCVLSRTIALRCSAPDLLCRVYPLRLVALVARRSRGGRGARGSTRDG